MDKFEKSLLEKYGKQLDRNISTEDVKGYKVKESYSRDYLNFREDSFNKRKNLYERLSLGFGRLLTVKPSDKEYDELAKSIEAVHLKIKPEDAVSFGTISIFLMVLLVIVVSALFLLSSGSFSLVSLVVPLLLILILLLLIKPLSRIPVYMARKWRLQAGNQMVLCVLYIVMYMRHTSNLEHALKFASEHVGNPLALDLRKIFWDIEIGKYSTLKESLDSYLITWRDYNLEFVEAMHLIEGSLYEQNEDRRISLLEKSLDVMLNGTYDKMMHYAQDLKNPITMIHMLGVILPILGLVILPLVGSLMGGSGLTKIIVLFLIYNILLPVVVYVFGTNVLSKRPTGYNETNILNQNPELKKYENIIINFGKSEIKINPFWIGLFIFVIIAFIGFIPLLMHAANVDFNFLGTMFLDYKNGSGFECSSGDECFGPFGVGAVFLSLFFPLGLALGMGTYYKIKSNRFVKIREETKKLEQEFSGGLFQLGNRVGDGIPIEVAFFDVASTMGDTPTGTFFSIVSNNISQMGMSVKDAIFGERGAIWYYPSSLIESSMKVLLQSAKKGPDVVAKALTSISSYISNIHRVNERLKDLLSEVISSMKSQISFLTPVIAGIVVGIGAMIVTILGRLTSELVNAPTTGDEAFSGSLGGLAGLFEITSIIPSYYLQLIIGLYVIQIAFILTILANGIENGSDKISERSSLSKNLYMSGIIYFLIAAVVTFIFTLLATSINIGPGI